jgi:hypothetical protein
VVLISANARFVTAYFQLAETAAGFETPNSVRPNIASDSTVSHVAIQL